MQIYYYTKMEKARQMALQFQTQGMGEERNLLGHIIYMAVTLKAIILDSTSVFK